MNIEERSLPPIHHVKVEVEDRQDVEDEDYDFKRKYACVFHSMLSCFLVH